VKKRWLLPLLSTLLASALFVATIGLFQFWFSSTWPIGFCMPIASPWDCLTYWFKSDRQAPIYDCLSRWQWARLAWSTTAVVFLLGMLILSIRAQRPLRLSLRLRSLMILIAVMAFGYVAGHEVWTIWARWESYVLRAEHYASMEEALEREDVSEFSILSVDERREAIEELRKIREGYGEMKRNYRRAAWCPWIVVDSTR
jgi:hypothetical protein